MRWTCVRVIGRGAYFASPDNFRCHECNEKVRVKG